MAILETLYILWKGDASQLKKESAEVQKENEKTVTSMKQVDDINTKVGDSFSGLARTLIGYATGLVAIGTVLSEFKNSIDYAAHLNSTTQLLGTNTEALDAWSNAIRSVGGNAESFQASLQAFAKHLNTTGTVALAVLPRLADTFQRLGRFRALRLGEMLGLDEATILLLQRGRREIEAMLQRQRELGVVTKNQAELSRKLDYELGNTGQAFRSLALTVGETLIPIFDKVLVAFQNAAIYLRGHSDLIVGALIAIGGAAAVAAIEFGLLSAPILLAAAAVAAFALVYEDITTHLRGGKSLLGGAVDVTLKEIHILKAAFDGLRKSVEWLLHLRIPGFKQAGIEEQKFAQVNENIAKGRGLINQASSSNINGQTNTSILNNNRAIGGNRVDISQIIINTQATDAVGIGTALGNGISNYFDHTNSQFDNGVFV